MVGPHAQQVVGHLRPNGARNRLLAAHGVQGHDAALKAQHAQQLRDDRDFVGVVVHLLNLPQRMVSEHPLPGSTMASMLRWELGRPAHQAFLRCQGNLYPKLDFVQSPGGR